MTEGHCTRVRVEELRPWMAHILRAENADPDVAGHVIEGLIQTSLRGVDSHGVRLFPHYVRTLRAGGVNGRPTFRFDRSAAACGMLDADHTFGHAAGAVAMRHAIDLAKNAGVGSVAVRNSSHFGAAAYYALMAAEENFIGMAFTHADALLLTHGGRSPYLGPNPICFAAPCEKEAPFCLDMSCSFISWNKVRQHRAQLTPLGAGVAADADGRETRDPGGARSLFPIGAYKGYGLAMMVEIFCSLLTGMAFGKHLEPMFTVPPSTHRRLGHFFVAMDVSRFTAIGEFKKRLKNMVDELRTEPRFQDDVPILVPGDPEKLTGRTRSREGIPIPDSEWRELEQIGRDYQVAPPDAVREAAVS